MFAIDSYLKEFKKATNIDCPPLLMAVIMNLFKEMNKFTLTYDVRKTILNILEDYGNSIGMVTIKDFDKFIQKKFEKQVIVLKQTGKAKVSMVYYSGASMPHENRIYVMLQGAQFEYCKKLSSIIGLKNMCKLCQFPRRGPYCHNYRCEQNIPCCPHCRSRPPCKFGTEEPIHCDSCNRFFVDKKCYEKHQANETCEKFVCCQICGKTFFSTVKDHKCNKKFCLDCKVWVPMNDHICFLQPLTNLQPPPKYVIYYDSTLR